MVFLNVSQPYKSNSKQHPGPKIEKKFADASRNDTSVDDITNKLHVPCLVVASPLTEKSQQSGVLEDR